MSKEGRSSRVGYLCAVLLLSWNVLAQSSSTPRRVVIRAGHLLDVKTGNTLSGQAIVIEGDRIVSVGPVHTSWTDAERRSPRTRWP